jgi:hypothetical protein
MNHTISFMAVNRAVICWACGTISDTRDYCPVCTGKGALQNLASVLAFEGVPEAELVESLEKTTPESQRFYRGDAEAIRAMIRRDYDS